MIEPDTVKLLRECDAGTRMGVASIDDVLPYVRSHALKKYLTDCKEQHEMLKKDLQQLLDQYGDRGKEPGMIAKGMSRMKTEVKLTFHESDHTVADLMTDGCNMGVKSLSRYLNQYKAADEDSKTICKRLIRLEEQLAVDLRGFL